MRIVLLICELLVNGTPPLAVSADIQSFCSIMNGLPENELPSLNFVRQCRVVVQNLNELLAAYRLGNAKEWIEVFTDGTSRRQIAFQNLVIGLMNGDKFELVIASSCIILENEMSEKQVEGIMDKVCMSIHYMFV